MCDELSKKIELIRQINSDDATYISNVYEAYKKNEKSIKEKKENTSINQKNSDDFVKINLDKIWAKPYFYTKMRVQLDGIKNKLIELSEEYIKNNPTDSCNEIIFNNNSVDFIKDEGSVDLVDFIRTLKKGVNYSFEASEINEEALFKEEQLKMAIDIINTKGKFAQNEKVYNYTYQYLNQDFVSNNYCDFKNDQCVAQRNKTRYPMQKRDGCCHKTFLTCKHLKNGICDTECLACRLFSCTYLTNRGIQYWASELVLVKAFYSGRQKRHAIHGFWNTKKNIMKKINYFYNV